MVFNSSRQESCSGSMMHFTKYVFMHITFTNLGTLNPTHSFTLCPLTLLEASCYVMRAVFLYKRKSEKLLPGFQ